MFINDIFFFIDDLYNYADDNTISRVANNPLELKQLIDTASEMALTWFQNNQMQTNPAKFQSIVFGMKSKNDSVTFNVGGCKVTPSSDVKLLGVHIDEKLCFDKHLSTICTKYLL